MIKKRKAVVMLTLLTLTVFASIVTANAQEPPVAHNFRFPLAGDWAPLWQDFNRWNSDWKGYHLGEDVGREDADKQSYPVYPMGEGIVKFANIVLGYTVLIEHKLPVGDPDGNYVCSVYYHMKRPGEGGIQLTVGTTVSMDSPIGYVSGKWEDHKSSPHLHFGIRKGRYKTGKDPRTGYWYYPGYTTIKKDGEVQNDPNDPTHQLVLAEWFNPTTDSKNGTGFIERHQPTKTVTVDLYFNKSNFTTGAVKDSTVTVTGSGYTVKTYVQMTKPDGTQRHVYYPNPNFQPTDPLYFSDVKRPLYDGTWDVHDSTWLWDRYQFAGSEPEGTWTWEFWYEDVDNPDTKLVHDSESYTFARPSQRTAVTIGDLQYYEFAANRVSSSTAAINVIYFVYQGYGGYPEFRTGSNAPLAASEFGIAMRSPSETIYEDLDPTIIPGPITEEEWETQNKPRCYVKNTGKSTFEIGDLFAFKTTDGQYIKAKITNLNSAAKEVTMEWEYYPGYHSQVHNETNFINQGQQILTQFVLDPLISWFQCFLNWPGSEMQLVLVKPDGSEITPDVAQTNPNIIHYYTPTSNCYTIATPDPGQWHARISGVDAASEGEQYSLNVIGASDVLTYMLGFSPTYFIGDTVNIGMVLKENVGNRTYEPLLNIDVTAQISRPDNSTDTLDLYDDGNHGDNSPGDGIYANVYTNLDIYGPYQIAVTAEGTRSNGRSFSREIHGSIPVGGIDTIGIDRASLTPPDGSKAKDTRPAISATIVGPSFNIDTSSIMLALDGEVVPHTFDTVNQVVSYVPSTDTAYGLRTATLDLKDSRGNSVPQASWSFTVPLNAFAYPNPCYPDKGQRVKIATNVPATSDMKVQIYDLAANLVRVLEGETEIHIEEDSQVATWDCTNEKEERVARGIYIYLITTSNDKKIGKIAIIK